MSDFDEGDALVHHRLVPADLTEALRSSRGQAVGWESLCRELTHQLGVAAKELEAKEAQVGSLQQQVEQLRMQTIAGDSLRRQLQDEVDQLRTTNRKVKQRHIDEVEVLVAERDRARRASAQERKESQKLQESVRSLKNRLAQAEGALASQQTELNRVNRRDNADEAMQRSRSEAGLGPGGLQAKKKVVASDALGRSQSEAVLGMPGSQEVEELAMGPILRRLRKVEEENRLLKREVDSARFLTNNRLVSPRDAGRLAEQQAAHIFLAGSPRGVRRPSPRRETSHRGAPPPQVGGVVRPSAPRSLSASSSRTNHVLSCSSLEPVLSCSSLIPRSPSLTSPGGNKGELKVVDLDISQISDASFFSGKPTSPTRVLGPSGLGVKGDGAEEAESGDDVRAAKLQLQTLQSCKRQVAIAASFSHWVERQVAALEELVVRAGDTTCFGGEIDSVLEERRSLKSELQVKRAALLELQSQKVTRLESEAAVFAEEERTLQRELQDVCRDTVRLEEMVNVASPASRKVVGAGLVKRSRKAPAA